MVLFSLFFCVHCYPCIIIIAPHACFPPFSILGFSKVSDSNSVSPSEDLSRFNQLGLEINPPSEVLSQVSVDNLHSLFKRPFQRFFFHGKSLEGSADNSSLLSGGLPAAEASTPLPLPADRTLDMIAKYKYKFMRCASVPPRQSELYLNIHLIYIFIYFSVYMYLLCLYEYVAHGEPVAFRDSTVPILGNRI